MNSNEQMIVLPYGEAALQRTCTTELGADLTGLWLMKDAVFDSLGRCVSIPGRVGNTFLNTSVTNFFTETVEDGRTGILSVPGNDAAMKTSIAATPVEVWALAKINTVPAVSYGCVAMGWKNAVGVNRYLQCTDASNAWYGAIGGDQYRDGVANDNYDTSVHIYASDITVGELISDELYIGNDPGFITNRSLDGVIYALMTTSVSVTPAKRLSLANAFMRYMTDLA